MKVTSIKTEIVNANQIELTHVLSSSLRFVPENSVIAITSKIISLCEGNFVSLSENKDKIIEEEADIFLPKGCGKYGVYLTIKNGIITPNAGVDESNAGGGYLLWPKDPQASSNSCWDFLRSHYGVKNIGVIITDSSPTPLKWGVTGICLAYCGFQGVNSKVGKRDLFGHELKMTRINVADSLAAAAVLCMGEADEQTPVAVLEELPFVQFQQKPPSREELEANRISLSEDLYGPLLGPAPWKSRKTQ